MNHYIKQEVSEYDLMSNINSHDRDGYELVTCTLLSEHKVKWGEFSHHETPAKFLLIFKRAMA
jgi:hypothetical protein